MLIFSGWLLNQFSILCAAPPPQLIEGLVNIRFQPDVRVFAVMAAINCAGFDLDADRLQDNPTRRMVRERLCAALDPMLRERLHKAYQEAPSFQSAIKAQSDFISFALHTTGPPEFKISSPAADLPPEVQPLAGLEHLLGEIWRQGELERLWDPARKQCVQEIEAYRPLMQEMIVRTLRFMHTDARVALDRQVIFIPDLLGAYGSVNARNVDSDYIIVAGPSRSAARPMHGVRHEYLHFLLDPLLAKYRSHFPETEPFMKRVREQRNSNEMYARDFDLMVAESLFRMLELRLDSTPRDAEEKALLEAYDQGLILGPYFLDELRSFEISRDSIQEFFPRLIDGLKWSAESKRQESVERLRQGRESRELEQIRDKTVQDNRRTAIRDMLAKANSLLQNRDYEKAKEALQAVLNVEPANPNALYGMAQIALQDDDLDRALHLYGEALSYVGSEAWIAGWARVQRGKIFAIRGDYEAARQDWKQVLSLNGDLRGAADAAKKALASSP